MTLAQERVIPVECQRCGRVVVRLDFAGDAAQLCPGCSIKCRKTKQRTPAQAAADKRQAKQPRPTLRKTCRQCNRIRPIEDYHAHGFDKNGNVTHRARCKDCIASQYKAGKGFDYEIIESAECVRAEELLLKKRINDSPFTTCKRCKCARGKLEFSPGETVCDWCLEGGA